jgi:transposase-like protein
MMPGVKVADVARKYGTTRWQVYDWRKQLRRGNLVLPERVGPCLSSPSWWWKIRCRMHHWPIVGLISKSS